MNGFDLSTASEIYMGSSEISALYIGSELIWPSNYENEYFTITSLTNNNSISVEYVGTKYNIDHQFEVSTDKTNWTNYIFNPMTETTKTLGLLNNGNRLYIRGNNQRLADNAFYQTGYHICFKTTGSFKLSGNIMSLIDSTNYTELTSVNTYAFSYLFYGNGWLTDARNLYLPATTLATFCYAYMFWGCSSLTTAPALPATTLANWCYYNMFTFSHIITAPALPATTLADLCYAYMFNGCTLTTAPAILPATTLASDCYRAMFANCNRLTTAPALPATTLANSCYNGMFSNCSRLTTAPELPATTLATQCYYNMFSNCSRLTTAPELPATTLTAWCYRGMFSDCTSLSEITMLATDISADNCLTNWVSNVAVTGTFYKNSLMTTLPTGDSGIPIGWIVNDIVRYSITISQTTNGTVTSNVQNAEAGDTITLTVTPDTGYELDTLTILDASSNPVTVTNNQFTMPASNVTVSATFKINYKNQYLTIESQAANNVIYWKCSSNSGSKSIYVSTDRTNWTSKTANTTGVTLATLGNGDKLYVRGNLYGYSSASYYSYITSTYNFKVYGNIMSLTDGDNFASATSLTQNYQLASLFRSSKVTDITNLIMPATTLKKYCYQNMFNGCTQLTTAATKLPATSVDYYSYANMFQGCTSLVTPPVLCGITLGGYAYQSMFQGCTSLTTLPRLADGTTITSWVPYRMMFSGCTGITDARYDVNGDRLLPTHLTVSSGGSAYERMFENCTNLQYAPELTDMTPHHGEYNQMFKGCTSLYSIITHADSLGTANFGAIVENTGHVGTVYKAKDVTWDTSQYEQFKYNSTDAWTVIDGDYNAGDYQT